MITVIPTRLYRPWQFLSTPAPRTKRPAPGPPSRAERSCPCFQGDREEDDHARIQSAGWVRAVPAAAANTACDILPPVASFLGPIDGSDDDDGRSASRAHDDCRRTPPRRHPKSKRSVPAIGPPTRCCLTHIARPKAANASMMLLPAGGSDLMALSKKNTPAVCKAMPSMSGRTVNGMTPTTGALAIRHTAHQAARAGARSSRAIRVRTPGRHHKPEERKRSPGDPRARDRIEPGILEWPGQDRGQVIVERRVDEHQGVLPAERPVQTPRARIELTRHRKDQRRFEASVSAVSQSEEDPERRCTKAAIDSMAVTQAETQARPLNFRSTFALCFILTVPAQPGPGRTV